MSNVIILDCGATNVRAIAVNHQGRIVASHYIRNETIKTKTHPVQHVWDFEQIWDKLIQCCQKVASKIGSHTICAISVTTFGVDGAPFDKNGLQIYPIISWKCSRTIPVMELVESELDRQALYQINGIGDYNFNTFYKLKWLKDNEPEIYQRMDKFVFISSMLTYRLTGILTTDRTMAGTSMLTTLQTGEWNISALNYLNLSEQQFPPIVNAGEKIGNISTLIANQLGLPEGIPVVSCGHDTQFALFGSGVEIDQPFLSSGTWEILMARTHCPNLHADYLQEGLTTEFDADNSLYNPAIQWLSSGIMEWISNTLYTEHKDNQDLYRIMVEEGESVPPGCNGVHFTPKFLPNQKGNGEGAIHGLSINTTRGDIYRAALESLAHQLKSSLAKLSMISDFKPKSLVVVGGGSKNSLWNQIRADVINLPLHIVEESEATVIGAAMYAFFGAGTYNSIYQAQQAMKPQYYKVLPSENHTFYQQD
ncbi:L-fuculokinase [Vibrio aphrogenes]|uniref:L-fuculokinase n=1 Tax=Vibrio aphrogenes TaxID=1891186 RepID=UPI000B353D3E|nr:L-fuculokinase [Vibrio aphrogenes]